MRVYYSQKTDSVIKNFELSHLKGRMYEKLKEIHQILSDNWLRYTLGERMK